MPNPGSIIGQITEELGELGKQVVTETVKAPKDIAGKALESLGASSGKTQQGKQTSATPPQGTEKPAVEEFSKTGDESVKREIARRALEELSGKKPQPKELSVWEKIQKEEEEKKELEKKKKEAAAKQALPQQSSKRRRGDLYGIKAKKSSVENRNVRQD